MTLTKLSLHTVCCKSRKKTFHEPIWSSPTSPSYTRDQCYNSDRQKKAKTHAAWEVHNYQNRCQLMASWWGYRIFLMNINAFFGMNSSVPNWRTIKMIVFLTPWSQWLFRMWAILAAVVLCVVYVYMMTMLSDVKQDNFHFLKLGDWQQLGSECRR